TAIRRANHGQCGRRGTRAAFGTAGHMNLEPIAQRAGTFRRDARRQGARGDVRGSANWCSRASDDEAAWIVGAHNETQPLGIRAERANRLRRESHENQRAIGRRPQSGCSSCGGSLGQIFKRGCVGMSEGEADAAAERPVAKPMRTDHRPPRTPARAGLQFRLPVEPQLVNCRFKLAGSVSRQHIARANIASAPCKHLKQADDCRRGIFGSDKADMHCARAIAAHAYRQCGAIILQFGAQPHVRRKPVETQRAAAVDGDGNLWCKPHGERLLGQRAAHIGRECFHIENFISVETGERAGMYRNAIARHNAERRNGRGETRRRYRTQPAHLNAAPCRDLNNTIAVLACRRTKRHEHLRRYCPERQDTHQQAVAGLHRRRETGTCTAAERSVHGTASARRIASPASTSLRRGCQKPRLRAASSRAAMAAAACGFSRNRKPRTPASATYASYSKSNNPPATASVVSAKLTSRSTVSANSAAPRGPWRIWPAMKHGLAARARTMRASAADSVRALGRCGSVTSSITRSAVRPTNFAADAKPPTNATSSLPSSKSRPGSSLACKSASA